MGNKKSNIRYALFFIVFAVMIAAVLGAVTFNNDNYSPSDNYKTTNPAPPFTFNATSDVDPTVDCTLFIDGTDYNTTDGIGSGFEVTMIPGAALDQGTYTWYINCTDSDGVVKSDERTLAVDNLPPNVTISYPNAGNWINDDGSNVIFMFNDYGVSLTASCTIYADGSGHGTNSSVLNDTSTSIGISPGLSEGSHSLNVNCTDEAGNEGSSSSLSLNVDTVLPVVTATSPGNGNLTSNNRPSFIFTLSDATSPNSTCVLYIGTNSYNTSTLSNGAATLIPNITINNGVYNWNITCTDLANNLGASIARSITIDTDAPEVNLLNTSFNTPINITSITFNFSDADSAANCSLFFDGVSVSNNVSVLNMINTILTSSEQPEGVHSVYVNCTDTSGLTGQSNVINVTIDMTSPTITINSPSDGEHVYDNTIDINFTVSDEFSPPFSCTVFVNGSHYGNDSGVGEGIATIITNSTARTEGTYSVVVNCTDNAGNLGTSGEQTFIIDRTAPSIIGLASSGTTTGTATITATTDENASCWYSLSNFTAENITGETAMSGTGTTHTFAKTYTATGTIGPYYISCRDLAGNNMTTSNTTGEITVAVTGATIHHSSSGGGGTVPSNPSNSQTWIKVTPGVATIMKILGDDFGVKEIIIEVNNPANNVKIDIVKLPGKPASVTKNITGKVYRYLELKKTNLNDSDIRGDVKVKFQVTQSWLLTNNLDAKNIVLKRFASDAWQDLKTTLLSTDNVYGYYEAETPGMSFFAIGEKSAIPTASVPKLPEQPAGSQPPAEQSINQSKEQPPGEQPPATEPGVDDEGKASEEKSESGSTVKTVLIMVAIFLVIAAIVAWVSKGGRMPRIRMPNIRLPKLFHKHPKFKTLEDDE